MPLTIELPPEKEAAFLAQAAARGLSLEQWILEIADQSLQLPSISHRQKAANCTSSPRTW